MKKISYMMAIVFCIIVFGVLSVMAAEEHGPYPRVTINWPNPPTEEDLGIKSPELLDLRERISQADRLYKVLKKTSRIEVIISWPTGTDGGNRVSGWRTSRYDFYSKEMVDQFLKLISLEVK